VPEMMARAAVEADPDVVEALCKALSKGGEAATRALVEVVTRHDMLRMSIAKLALGWMGETGAAAVLGAVRSDQSEWVLDAMMDVMHIAKHRAAPLVPQLVGMLDAATDEQYAGCLVAVVSCLGPAGA